MNRATEAVSRANDQYSQGKIDNPSNLNGDPVYIFSGKYDDRVPPAQQEAQRDYYNTFSANVDYVS